MAKLIFENAPTKEYKLNKDGSISKKNAFIVSKSSKKKENDVMSKEDKQVLFNLRKSTDKGNQTMANANFSSVTGENIFVPAPVIYQPKIDQKTPAQRIGGFVSNLISGETFNAIRRNRNQELLEKSQLQADKQRYKTDIAVSRQQGKTDREEAELIGKTQRDLFNTNIFEKLLGQQSQAERDLRDQLQSNVALEYQTQLLAEELRNANAYIGQQSELLAVKQQAQSQGIELPSISTDKTFLQKYGVPIAIGLGVVLLAATNKRK